MTTESDWEVLTTDAKLQIAKEMQSTLKGQTLPFLAGRNRGIEAAAELVDECVDRDPSLKKLAMAIRNLKI